MVVRVAGNRTLPWEREGVFNWGGGAFGERAVCLSVAMDGGRRRAAGGGLVSCPK